MFVHTTVTYLMLVEKKEIESSRLSLQTKVSSQYDTTPYFLHKKNPYISVELFG